MVTKTIFLVLILINFLFPAENGIPWSNPPGRLLTATLRMDTVAKAFKDAENTFSLGEKKEKKPAIAFGMSLLLPGSGQFYNGNYWRAALYSGIEVLSWTMVAVYNHKGDNEDEIFRSYADDHWTEVIYWAKVYQLGVNAGVIQDEGQGWSINEVSSPGSLPSWIYGGFSDYYFNHLNFKNDLRDNENNVANYFTHSLPETKTQQYYEMIGKYSSQFGNAWDDADFNRKYLYGEGSPRNKEYYDMRNLSNDYYDIAGNWISIAMINHLASALDGLWTAKSYNKSINIGYKPRFIEGKLINTYAVNIRF